MPESAQPLQKKPKKAVSVPDTDISLGEDKSTRNFVLAMVGLTVLIIIVGGGVLYWLIGRYVYQTNQNKAQDKSIDLLEKKKVDIAALRPNYDAINVPAQNGKSDADLILNAMPTDEGFKELIAMIEKMGQESGVKIPTVSKGGTASAVAPTASGDQSYSIAVNIEGTLPKILDFIRKTESSSRVMDFVNLTVSGTGNLTASANFKVYWRAPANIEPTQEELK
jgi:Tfp pilus assembly protein PilO